MSGRAFLDSNIFIYAIDNADPAKMQIAQRLIREHAADRRGVISFQVIQEFFNVVLKKFESVLASGDAASHLHGVLRPFLEVNSSIALYEAGLAIQQRYQLSWYESLIVAAADEAGCSVIYTEDLHHGSKINGIRIENPFLKKRPH